MKIVPTRRTDYGIRALVYLAHHAPDRLKATEIAEAMDIPEGFLHQVLGDLQRAGFVTSQTGRTGGYALSGDPGEVSMLQIVEALEGSLALSECALRGGPCHWDDVCALHWVWTAARSAFVDQLARATLADVAEDDRALLEGRRELPEESHRRRGGWSAR
jgi:Rrf2 family protein